MTDLRVMSMNLENLFSPGVNFYGSQYTQAEFDQKMDWVARTFGHHHVGSPGAGGTHIHTGLLS